MLFVVTRLFHVVIFMKKQLLLLSVSFSLLLFADAHAIETLEVQGLFSNKAVLMVDGRFLNSELLKAHITDNITQQGVD